MSAALGSLSRAPTSLPITTFIAVTLLTLSACSRAHVSSQLTAPARFEELPTEAQPAARPKLNMDAPWWRGFSDPQLNGFVEGIFSDNLQLAQALQRVAQLRAVAAQAGSQRWPSLNLDLSWSRTKQLNPFARLNSSSAPPSAAGAPSASGGMPSSFTQDRFQASLAVSYELDVWGRIGSITEAAELDAMASEADLKAMAISISATAVELYFQLIEAQQRLEIITSQLADDQDALSISRTRFEQGLAPQIELLQQTQQRDRTSAQLPPARALISSLKRRLAALQGAQQLTGLSVPSALPSPPPLPPLGLPASVLESRPDVQAARARLSAADARVSAAVSARLPGLRLGASGGYQSFELKELFDDVIWSVTGGLVAPLFQGGRLKAEQARAEASLRERLFALKERYLSAYHEVEDALNSERSAKAQLELIRAQLSSAEALSRSAQERYLQGVGDLLTSLTARQGLYASQLATLSAERALLSARVQLHRALGGDPLSLSPLTQTSSGDQDDR